MQPWWVEDASFKNKTYLTAPNFWKVVYNIFILLFLLHLKCITSNDLTQNNCKEVQRFSPSRYCWLRSLTAVFMSPNCVSHSPHVSHALRFQVWPLWRNCHWGPLWEINGDREGQKRQDSCLCHHQGQTCRALGGFRCFLRYVPYTCFSANLISLSSAVSQRFTLFVCLAPTIKHANKHICTHS